MIATEVMETLRKYATSGERVRLAWTLGGRTFKHEAYMSPAEALAAARTVDNLGGEVTSVFRLDA